MLRFEETWRSRVCSPFTMKHLRREAYAKSRTQSRDQALQNLADLFREAVVRVAVTKARESAFHCDLFGSH
jgi:hypothetical protein